MAYTLGQLAALEAALASGATTITYQGRSITYRSVEELKAAISTVKNSMAVANGTRVRQIRFGSRKGL
jgi:hypothetical protein